METMIIDNHCDVLYQLYTYPDKDFQHTQADANINPLAVNLQYLKQADVRLQCFAIYIDDAIPQRSFQHIQAYIQLFHERILKHPSMMAIRNSTEMSLSFEKGKIGAMLTLEGVDALQGQVDDVELLFQLGVRCIGITWNYANWAADGVLEPRQAAFTKKGRQLINRCEQLGIILDCSHLCEPAFWELCEQTHRPFIASHSNAYAQCRHPRNLRDEQIVAIKNKGGMIGLTFVPQFLVEDGEASREDLLKHIDHFASLGLDKQITLGSDFDGTDAVVEGLEHMGQLVGLKDWLLKYYDIDFVEGLMWRNAFCFYQNHLPTS